MSRSGHASTALALLVALALASCAETATDTPAPPTTTALDVGAIPDAELPRGELVLFLKNYGTSYVESGYAEPADSPRWGWWFMTTSFQGALRNIDGLVDVPAAPDGWWASHGPFPGDIDGQPFEHVVSRIRELVGR